MRVFAGVDPGYAGAFAYVVGEDEARVFDVPLYAGVIKGKHGDYDLPAMRDLLLEAVRYSDGGLVYLALEQSIPLPRQSSSSTAKAARGAALWEGLAIGCDVVLTTVPPVRWKKAMELTSDKTQSLVMARELYPCCASSLKRQKDHGRAEALLLAEWLRRNTE